jgi:DNA polymerase
VSLREQEIRALRSPAVGAMAESLGNERATQAGGGAESRRGGSLTKDEQCQRYRRLVEKRRKCSKCRELGLVNPARDKVCRVFDWRLPHIGPWTAWQGSLHAELLVVGKDWGRVQEFRDQGGRDSGGNPTNAKLRRLLESIGFQIDPPGWEQDGRLYFTNAVLCLRQDGCEPNGACFNNCVSEFLKAQIDLIQPKVIVTLGLDVYTAVMGFYRLQPEGSMESAVEKEPPFERIGACTSKLVPVFHPGFRAERARSEGQQVADWRRVKQARED